MAEKHWPPEETSAYHGREARPRSFEGCDAGDRNPEIGAEAKKMRKLPTALDTGGRNLLEWPAFQAWFGSRLSPSWTCGFIQPRVVLGEGALQNAQHCYP